jgi:sigma-B regulation protein RsbU (phosphoserine phosphatase)
MIHEGLRSGVPLPEIGRGANEFFCQHDLCARYATFVIACVQPNGAVEYLNCAHVPPVIVRVGREGVRLRESNVPVGLLADAEYQSTGFQMEPGIASSW